MRAREGRRKKRERYRFNALIRRATSKLVTNSFPFFLPRFNKPSDFAACGINPGRDRTIIPSRFSSVSSFHILTLAGIRILRKRSPSDRASPCLRLTARLKPLVRPRRHAYHVQIGYFRHFAMHTHKRIRMHTRGAPYTPTSIFTDRPRAYFRWFLGSVKAAKWEPAPPKSLIIKERGRVVTSLTK